MCYCFRDSRLGHKSMEKNLVGIWQYGPKKSANKRYIIAGYFHFVFIFICRRLFPTHITLLSRVAGRPVGSYVSMAD